MLQQTYMHSHIQTHIRTCIYIYMWHGPLGSIWYCGFGSTKTTSDHDDADDDDDEDNDDDDK